MVRMRRFRGKMHILKHRWMCECQQEEEEEEAVPSFVKRRMDLAPLWLV
jgi:hypothetical protein